MSFPARAHAKQRSASARAEEGQKVQENEGKGGRGATLWQSRKKLTFALIIKLTKRSRAASTLKGGKWRRGAAQKWTEHLSGHTLNPLPSPPKHTRHPLSGKQKHVRRDRERQKEREREEGRLTADLTRWLTECLKNPRNPLCRCPKNEKIHCEKVILMINSKGSAIKRPKWPQGRLWRRRRRRPRYAYAPLTSEYFN